MLTIPAYAKVNLALDVIARRSDGWHDIETLILPIDWHDVVGVRLSHGEPSLHLSGATPGIPGADGSNRHGNLAWRAAEELSLAHRDSGSALDVWLHKRIPAAAGLGGGSADAAAVLRAGAAVLARHGAAPPAQSLHEIAAALGGDVPAMLARQPVRASGRGETLAPVRARQLHMVVVFVAAGSTAAAYTGVLAAEFGGGRIDALCSLIRNTADISEELLGSALEPAALRANPNIGAGLGRLRALEPGRAWHMTGSGGAFFSLVRDADAGLKLCQKLRASAFHARTCRSVDLAG